MGERTVREALLVALIPIIGTLGIAFAVTLWGAEPALVQNLSTVDNLSDKVRIAINIGLNPLTIINGIRQLPHHSLELATMHRVTLLNTVAGLLALSRTTRGN
jgi:hypothetical protein